MEDEPTFDGDEVIEGTAPPGPPPPPLRVFCHGVDTYVGKRVVQSMQSAMVRLPSGDEEASGDSASEASEAALRPVEIVGTLFDANSTRPAAVAEIVSSESEKIMEEIARCDVIIYDILLDVEQAAWIVEEIGKVANTWESPKLFVCLSTLMTWCRTPKDDDDSEPSPLTEDVFKRRKPHPNFKAHLAVEKAITKHASKNKKKLSSYVISRGILYGDGEDVLHFLFRTAWSLSREELPIVGGPNTVSAIHVADFAAVITGVITERPDSKYIIAADDSESTMSEIAQAIATTLGTGKSKRVRSDDALLVREYTQVILDLLRADLHVEATTARDLDISWQCAEGLVENIQAVVTDYRETRGLTPLKVLIQGPPASGKTYFSAIIAKEYRVHHILMRDVIREYLDYVKTLQDRPLKEELKEMLEEGLLDTGRYKLDVVVQMYRWKLNTPACQNQGFLLDGFPKTLDQAEELFAPDEEEEGDDSPELDYDPKILPEYVIVIEASPDFLSERVLSLPEEQIQGTHNNSEDFKRRLNFFTEMAKEKAVWDFFDRREILPLVVQASDDAKVVLAEMRKFIGKAHNYGPTKEEIAQKKREKRAAEAKAAAAAQRLSEEQHRLDVESKAKSDAEWQNRLVTLELQEQQVLATQAMPLRDYLMDNVMPTLTAALIEVCQVRPDDPIDYLAEYLYQRDPAEDLEVKTTK